MIIDKGLSAGDVFCDDGRKFVVVEVWADGSYLASRTEETSPEETPPQEKPPEEKPPEETPPQEKPPEGTPFKCDECGKECANGAGLAAHMRAAHKSAD